LPALSLPPFYQATGKKKNRHPLKLDKLLGLGTFFPAQNAYIHQGPVRASVYLA